MRIKRLKEEVVKMIAAGEVIENPSSCVRELIENSIDASAGNIWVEIQRGGIRSLKVRDNGVGMEREEIPLSIERFTTSKIELPEDLKAIGTLGFRGEALYSIAGVSRLYIRSRKTEDGHGWEGYFEEGKMLDLKPVPHPVGTTVIVNDLFFNLPVRRKFLGSELQETRSIIDIVTKYAIAHPSIGFYLVKDDINILQFPPRETLRERLSDIFGGEIEEMLPVEFSIDDRLTIRGFISKPDSLKGSAVMQHIIINGRWVRERKLQRALYRVYNQEKRHPQFILHIYVSPGYIDFNIHPQKREVKFIPSLRITEKLHNVVKKAIFSQYKITAERRREFYIMSYPKEKIPSPSRQMEIGEMSYPVKALEIEGFIPDKLWQIHNTYILAQVKTGFVLIDQHAAHERIIYEKLQGQKYNIQRVLFPLVLHLTPLQFNKFQELHPILEKLGFQFNCLSGRTIIVEGVPDVWNKIKKEEILALIDEIENRGTLKEKLGRVLETVACKAAVKAGEVLSQEEMNHLLDQLFATENPFFCPHGRPLIIKWTLEELERRFGRR